MFDIFTASQEQTLDRSIGLHGHLNKSIISMEECAELIQAISKFARFEADPGMAKYFGDEHELVAHLTEEIANVLICIQTLQLMYGFTDEDLENWIDYKIKRQIKRDEKFVQRL